MLAVLNIRGIQESAKLNVFLALADLATQALLVIVGAVLILSPSVLVSNVHFGTGPTLSSFLISIPIGMVAYTGIETISNMAEEARDPGRDVPRSIGLVALAVFAIYAFLPAVALSAMPVHHVPSADPNTGSHFTSLLGSEFASDPVAGIVQNLGLGPLTTPVAYYVGVLAGTILIIATNAGIIGVSRLTYSMGQHRQFPNILRTVHPKYRTPWVAILIYAFAAIALMVPASLSGPKGIAFLGNLYAFGAMLSFTIAHAAVIALRLRHPDPDQPFRAPLNLRVGRLRRAAVRHPRRSRHADGVHRHVDAVPDRALHGHHLDGARHDRLRRLPQEPGAAADEDRAWPRRGSPARRSRSSSRRSCCTSPRRRWPTR